MQHTRGCASSEGVANETEAADLLRGISENTGELLAQQHSIPVGPGRTPP